jgi:hypothetical protein
MRSETSRLFVLTAAVLLPVFFFPVASAHGARGPSTAKERAKAAKLARELEAEPFGPKARDARRWLSLWTVEVPDYRFHFCPEALGGTVIERQRIRSEILAQTSYSGLAFVLENPGQAGSPLDVYRAGVLGALRAYEVILAKEPGARAPLLDALVAERDAGALDARLAENVKACRVRKF